tara:strand:+ start:704 stop:1003 length:300 start_codon:yes stop_codon:yes gene_type:complete
LQSFYPERFERVIWITEEEWLRCLPDAIGDYFSKLHANSAGVRIDEGALGLTWEVALPKKMGLISFPRLVVKFRFAGLDDGQRFKFMKRFDLFMHKGGG